MRLRTATAGVLLTRDAVPRCCPAVTIIASVWPPRLSPRRHMERSGEFRRAVLVFAHIFLKLSWALRQLNYTLAMIGAAPTKPRVAQRDRIARELGTLLSLAVRSFNAGIRGYYFALAALTWLVGPEAFMAATCGIVTMLAWRQFASGTAEAIRRSHVAVLGEEEGGGRRSRTAQVALATRTSN